MGIETVLIASAVMSGVSGIAQYSQQKKADKAAKQAGDEQARLMEQDAKRAAQEELAIADDARKTQRMAFLKSGVDLEGSPLLVMEETRAKGAENAKNLIEATQSRADLTRKQSSVGRASLVGTVANIGQSAAGSYTNYSLLKKQIA